MSIKLRKVSLTFVVLSLVCDLGSTAGSGLRVSINQDGSYRLLVDHNTWLVGGDTAFVSGGTEYSALNKSLKLVNSSTATGMDNFGPWMSTSFTYQAGQLPVMVSFKSYTDQEVPVIVFTQQYLANAVQTSANNSDKVISQFPSFLKSASPDINLGYMAYGGFHAGSSKLFLGEFTPSASIKTGMESGPLVLFDKTSNAIVISPMSQFMAVSNAMNEHKDIAWGIMGLVDYVPKDYSADFIVYYSNRGINEAMRGWGRYLKKLYRKSSAIRDNDLTLNFIGYWTDNGAYYYYKTEQNKTYQDTMLDVYRYIANLSVPIKYLEFDSWWYPKGHINGCTSWTPMPSVFPDGFKHVSDRTKLPFGCHNRYWDNQTVYARYNGGKYNFISDTKTGYAVPDDDQFWIDLFNMTQTWGKFILYEQDWLYAETEKNHILESDLFLGRRWLVGMGNGAQAFGITIQYCLSACRHILQSLEIPVVTQARVSHDYGPGESQWRIGKMAILVDALEIAPFKDTFWTTPNQPGNRYNKTEPYAQLNHLVSTLSTGPIGPGDGIGFINKTLLMKCCDVSGFILKPDKPIMSIDDHIKKGAFLTYPGPDGEVYTTYSDISGLMFGIILAADLKNVYDLTPSSGWTNAQLPVSMVFSSTNPKKWTPVPFSESSPLRLNLDCSIEFFCLYYTSPVIELDSGYKVILMGELEKWVPMSAIRFTNIEKQTDDVLVYLNVLARETVVFTFYLQDTLSIREIVCDNSQRSLPAFGTVISVVKGLCSFPELDRNS